MEGTRIKNIVILILLLLNGFLLFLVGSRWAKDTHSLETARNSAIEIVRTGGIKIEDAAVPRVMELEHMQAVRDTARESELAAELLVGPVRVEARGGEVYRYQNTNGWIQFHSTGEFMAELEPAAFLLGEQTAAQHGATLLEQLGFECQILNDGTEDGQGSITFRQLYKGVPILGCQATLSYQNGGLARITDARRVPGTPHHRAGEQSLSVASSLMRLYNGLKELGDIYTRVDSIVPAYTMSAVRSGTARLTPVWYVQTDTGSYQMDTQTGQISRMGIAAVVADAQMVVPEE